MIELIRKNQELLGELCQKFHIRKLEVFGSAARGDFNPETSDLDFIVELDNIPSGERLDAVFGFQRELERIFNRPVDLCEPGGMENPYFIRRVNQSRTTVYAA